MAAAGRPHPHLVSPDTPEPAPEPGAGGDLGDLVLTAAIFAISFLPIAGALAHLGRWGSGTLGLGAAGSVLSGRALWGSAAAALRARRRP